MTAQRRYDLLINESEAVGFDHCKLRVSEVRKREFLNQLSSDNVGIERGRAR